MPVVIIQGDHNIVVIVVIVVIIQGDHNIVVIVVIVVIIQGDHNIRNLEDGGCRNHTEGERDGHSDDGSGGRVGAVPYPGLLLQQHLLHSGGNEFHTLSLPVRSEALP